jgi:hypothetical protein
MKNLIETAEQETKENCEVLIVKRVDVEEVKLKMEHCLTYALVSITSHDTTRFKSYYEGLKEALKILHLNGEQNG